jgi:CHAT domain-containing protein
MTRALSSALIAMGIAIAALSAETTDTRVTSAFARALERTSMPAFRPLVDADAVLGSRNWLVVAELIRAHDCITIESATPVLREGDDLLIRIRGSATLRNAKRTVVALPEWWWLTVTRDEDLLRIARAETDAMRAARLLLDATSRSTNLEIAQALFERIPIRIEREPMRRFVEQLAARDSGPRVQLFTTLTLARLDIIDDQTERALALVRAWIAANPDAALEDVVRARLMVTRIGQLLGRYDDVAFPELAIIVPSIEDLTDPRLAEDIAFYDAMARAETFRFGEAIASRDRLRDLAVRHGWRSGLARAYFVSGSVFRVLREDALALDLFRNAILLAHDALDSRTAARTAMWYARVTWGSNAGRAIEMAPDDDADTRLLAMSDLAHAAHREQRGLAIVDEMIRLMPEARERGSRRDAWLRIGLVWAYHGRYAEGIEAYEQCMREAAPTILWTVWAAKLGRAEALMRLGRCEEAVEDLRESIELVEARRALMPSTAVTGAQSHRDKMQMYEDLAGILADLGREPEAIEILERGRARMLQQLIDVEQTEPPTTPAEAEVERKLNEDVVALNRAVVAATTGRERQAARLRLAEARNALDRFQIELVSRHPSAAVTAARPMAFAEITETPEPGTAIIDYVMSDRRTTIFVITRRDGVLRVQSRRVPYSHRWIADRVDPYTARVTQRIRGTSDASRELYRVLIEPIEDLLAGCTKLTIVPHGTLWTLPFQALQDRHGTPLVTRYAIAYTPSISSIEVRRRRAPRPAARPLLAVGGDPALLPPLPSVRDEVRQVAALYGPGAVTATGAAATEELVRRRAGEFGVLHFAAHGLADPESRYSALALTPAGSDDGLLEVREILDLRLNANLVVLAACETARGEGIAGEGMIALSWAFLAAGTPRVIATQWKAESESTSRLMVDFHRRMRRDRLPPAEALRRAQLALRRDERYSHPFYWAAFVVMGE